MFSCTTESTESELSTEQNEQVMLKKFADEYNLVIVKDQKTIDMVEKVLASGVKVNIDFAKGPIVAGELCSNGPWSISLGEDGNWYITGLFGPWASNQSTLQIVSDEPGGAAGAALEWCANNATIWYQ